MVVPPFLNPHRSRWFAQHAAFFYFFVVVGLYLSNPRNAYNLNQVNMGTLSKSDSNNPITGYPFVVFGFAPHRVFSM